MIAALKVIIDFWEHELPPNRSLRKTIICSDILAGLAQVLQQPEYQEAVLRQWTADLGPVARRVFNQFNSGYKRLFSVLIGLDKEQLKLGAAY